MTVLPPLLPKDKHCNYYRCYWALLLKQMSFLRVPWSVLGGQSNMPICSYKRRFPLSPHYLALPSRWKGITCTFHRVITVPPLSRGPSFVFTWHPFADTALFCSLTLLLFTSTKAPSVVKEEEVGKERGGIQILLLIYSPASSWQQLLEHGATVRRTAQGACYIHFTLLVWSGGPDWATLH